MSVVGEAQSMFIGLASDDRVELLSRLCLSLTVRLREALDDETPDLVGVRAYNEILHETLSGFPLLAVGSSNPHHGDALAHPEIVQLAALFTMAGQMGVGHHFQSAWDDAAAYVKSSALGPGANSNEQSPILAAITDRAKSRIEQVLLAYPARDRTRAVPILCWAGEPAIGGFYEERGEIEDQIVTVSGLDVVMALLEDDIARFQGKALDFDGEGFLLV